MPSDVATHALAEEGPEATGSDGGDVAPSSSLSSRLALGTFVAAVVVAFPLIIDRLGAYHWFLRDDWEFLTRSEGLGATDLFEPHNAHLTAVPKVVFAALWRLFGATTYTPYQAVVVALHLTVVVLLRVIMRRPWRARDRPRTAA